MTARITPIRQRADFVVAITDWLFDPDTSPEQAYALVAGMTRDNARAVIAELLLRDHDRRRFGEAG